MTSRPWVRITAERAFGPFDAETLRYVPGARVPSYRYDALNVCLVLSGACVERRGGHTHRYRGPALTVNTPDTRHEFDVAEEGVACLSINVDTNWLRKLADDGEVQAARGVFLIVWRRGADGHWRVQADMWN